MKTEVGWFSAIGRFVRQLSIAALHLESLEHPVLRVVDRHCHTRQGVYLQ